MGGPPPGPDLSGPPPPPTGVGAPTPSGPLAAGPPQPGKDPKGVAQDVMAMGSEIDRALLALTRIVTAGQDEIGQARRLIQAGLAKYLSSVGAAPASSPTAVGPSFPGGGLGSVKTGDSI